MKKSKWTYALAILLLLIGASLADSPTMYPTLILFAVAGLLVWLNSRQ